MRTKFVCLIIVSLLASLYGCGKQSGSNMTELSDPITVYQTAAEEANQRKDMTLNVSATKSISSNSEFYEQKTQQTLQYNDYRTEKMVAHSSETRNYGNQQIPITTTFQDGICYLDVSDGKFQAEISAVDYCNMYSPAVLFDADLYQNVTGITDGNTSTISFNDAKQSENWAMPEGATLISAHGSVILDASGVLQQSIYNIQYHLNGCDVTENISVHITPTKPEIKLPEKATYVQIPAIEAPILLEQSVGYLMQAKKITSITTEKITCEVFGDMRSQTTTLNLFSSADDYCARLDIDTTLENPGRFEKNTSQSQCIRYIDGVYSASVGGQITENRDITQEKMQVYCQDYLLSTILMSKYLSSVSFEQQDDVYKISFTASEDMAQIMRQHACETLYNDATVLDQLADSYTTDTMVGYITIDRNTCIPLSSGIHYVGTHQINGIAYPLNFETVQTYTIPSETAYNAIRS